MAKVQEAVFTPTAEGGTIQANMQVGSQEVTTRWPVTNDGDLRPLLDRLMVTVQQVVFASTPSGGEIRAHMRVGDRVFVSRWPIEGEDNELKPVLDRLMDTISRESVQNLLAELQRDASPAPSRGR